MAEMLASDSGTVTELQSEATPTEETLVLRLRKPKTDKKVQWQEGVVDNEFMGKKSSKCCCIYSKPRMFGESDSESDSDKDDECGCHEHKVARKPASKPHDPPSS